MTLKKKINDKGEHIHQLMVEHFGINGDKSSAWQYLSFMSDNGYFFRCYPPENSPPVTMPVHAEYDITNYQVLERGFRPFYDFGASMREISYFASQNGISYQWDKTCSKDIFLIVAKQNKQLHINLSSGVFTFRDLMNEQLVEFIVNIPRVITSIGGENNPNNTDLNQIKLANSLVSFYEDACVGLPQAIFEYAYNCEELKRTIRLSYADLIKSVEASSRIGENLRKENVIFSEQASSRYGFPAGEYVLEMGRKLFSNFTVYQIKKGFLGGEKVINRFTSDKRRELITDMATGAVILTENSQFKIFKTIGEGRV